MELDNDIDNELDNDIDNLFERIKALEDRIDLYERNVGRPMKRLLMDIRNVATHHMQIRINQAHNDGLKKIIGLVDDKLTEM